MLASGHDDDSAGHGPRDQPRRPPALDDTVPVGPAHPAGPPSRGDAPETPDERTLEIDPSRPGAAGLDATRGPVAAPHDATRGPDAAPHDAIGGPDAAPHDATSVPAQIGIYPVRGELGRGGMGVVYLAEDPRLRRPIAIKVLARAVAADATWLERFEREAQLLAALNHPNIATIHSLEEAGGDRFLTMELIPGDNLSDRLAGGPLPPDEALALCRQVTKALEAAHRRGVIHLDMKPGNVRVTPDGHVKVLDFGLARGTDDLAARASGGGVSGSGVILGSPGYMSPEQLRGDEPDRRADVWGLGCILYECLTGRRAIAGSSLTELVNATIEREPDWSALPDSVSGRVHDVVRRCLVRDVDARLDSVSDVRRALEEEITARSVAALRAASDEREPPRGRSVAVPDNLPVQLSSFVGRQHERARAAELLEAHRLVSLTGMGGSGKSRLAIEVAAGARERFPDGVWLLELAPLARPELLPGTLATVLGLREERDRPLIQTIAAHLATRRVLLVLDGCEHLLAGCATLAQTLLASCAELKIIATSRENLGVPGEAVFHVSSLALPDPGARRRPQELERFEAVQLFVERARAVRPDFALTADSAPSVVEICHRLDGIPLAIELAAARIRALPVREIAGRLDDRFRLLRGGSRTAVPRHQTLRALIDWSYETLEELEQTMLRRLAVFVGGFTLEAAEAVCADEMLDGWEVLDLVTALVDKSLVEMKVVSGDADGGGDRARYRMLETVRAYAAEKLAEAGETAAVAGRHRDVFVALAEEAAPHLTGAQQAAWFARLELEHDNLRTLFASGDAAARAGGSAADRALADRASAVSATAEPSAASDPDAVSTRLRAAAALGRFWEVRGHWSEGRQALAALPTAEEAGEQVALLATALVFRGNLAMHQGDYGPARTAFEASLAICRDLGAQRGIAQALNSLALVARHQGDLAEAERMQEESLAMSRALGSRRDVSAALNNLAMMAWFRGDVARARALHEESLALKRELGARRGIAASLSNLGIIARQQGDLDEAMRLYEESLEIRRELGDPSGIAMSLNNLGLVAELQGDLERAVELLEESLELKRQLGDRPGIAGSHFHLGTIARRRGDLDLTRQHLGESLARYGALDDRSGMATTLVALARLAHDAGDASRAACLIGAAEALVPEGVCLADTAGYDGAFDGALRASLGDAAYDAAIEQGRALSRDRLLELAVVPPGSAGP
ncbi:MAG: tetratricopeptide repeat protein [Candidatus Eiseniibacteriota bacterium]|jgi:non-specific serine/threonine protein kinase